MGLVLQPGAVVDGDIDNDKLVNLQCKLQFELQCKIYVEEWEVWIEAEQILKNISHCLSQAVVKDNALKKTHYLRVYFWNQA